MRIIGSQNRGLALASVGKGDTGAHLRPTTDRTRESLFNVLQGGRFGDPISDARVLDLFAGTGALGLEALSRGAARVCFVENGRVGQKLVMQNVAKLRAAEKTSLRTYDATRLPTNPYDTFDLIFLDPPYGKNLGVAALESAIAQDWITIGALIIWEDDAPQVPPAKTELVETREYGDTTITFLRAI